MDDKATPRPWRIAAHDSAVIVSESGEEVCDLNFSDYENDVDEANAKLIVSAVNSAPVAERLYESVRELIETIEDMRGEFILHGQIVDASAKYLHHGEPNARTAIADYEKAKEANQ